MADCNRLKPFILRYEGGFVNDPDDLGGATYKGVTFSTFKAYRKSIGMRTPTVTDMRLMSDGEWTAIFKGMFWDKWQADSIESQSVANMLVDWLWCSGSPAIRLPQAALGVSVDGIVGAKTIAAVNGYGGAEALFAKIKAERVAYIDRICKSRPKNRKYRRGWLNRIAALKYET